MTTYQEGEYLNITIKGARVRRTRTLPDDGVSVEHLSYDIGNYTTSLPLVEGVAVERMAPAEWPPLPGDIWGIADGGRWFAAQYHADFDNREDFEGCNEGGWRTVLVPMDIGPYGNSPGRPDEIRKKAAGQLTLVYREPALSNDDEPSTWTDESGTVWDLHARYTDSTGFSWHWAGGFEYPNGKPEPLFSRSDWSQQDVRISLIKPLTAVKDGARGGETS